MVVNTANTNDSIPKAKCMLGYCVASQPAVNRIRIMGSKERIRAVFSFIPITSVYFD